MSTTGRTAISFDDFKWKLFYAEQLKQLEDDLRVEVDLVDVEDNEESVEKKQIQRLKEYFLTTVAEKDEKILSLVRKEKKMRDQHQAALAEKDKRILNLLEELRTIRARVCNASNTVRFSTRSVNPSQSAFTNTPQSEFENLPKPTCMVNLEAAGRMDPFSTVAFYRPGLVKHRRREVVCSDSPKNMNLNTQKTESDEKSFQCQSGPRQCSSQSQLRFYNERKHENFKTKFTFKEFTKTPAWNSIPKLLHNIIGDLARDKLHLHCSIFSKGLTLNYIKVGSKEAENLEKLLRDLDPHILNLIVGHYYLNSTSTDNEIHPVKYSDEATLSKRTKLEKVSGELWVNDEVWERAYDASKNADTPKGKIESSARILFDAVMTSDEIERGTFSGRKNTEKFDDKKIRWIKAACVYIMKRPDKSNRNMTSFENDWVAGKLDMSATQEELIKEHVFCGHAYRQRKKLLSSKRTGLDQKATTRLG